MLTFIDLVFTSIPGIKEDKSLNTIFYSFLKTNMSFLYYYGKNGPFEITYKIQIFRSIYLRYKDKSVNMLYYFLLKANMMFLYYYDF